MARLPRRLLQFRHRVVVTRRAKLGAGDRPLRLPSYLLVLLRLNTRDTAAERDLFGPSVTQCCYQECAAINKENLGNCPSHRTTYTALHRTPASLFPSVLPDRL